MIFDSWLHVTTTRFCTDHLLLVQEKNRSLIINNQQAVLSVESLLGLRHEQMNSCSCLTLILACIIYWQAREIDRVLNERDPQSYGINVSLLEHVSPIEWENVVFYGEYVTNRDLIRSVRLRLIPQNYKDLGSTPLGATTRYRAKTPERNTPR
jgi:hypothetical protein